VVSKSSGWTRVSAVTVMKFESPIQRGKALQMQVPNDAGTRSAAQIHSEIHSIGL